MRATSQTTAVFKRKQAIHSGLPHIYAQYMAKIIDQIVRAIDYTWGIIAYLYYIFSPGL
jgi:hypothetical protein